MSSDHCCKTMSYWVNLDCEKHPNPEDCPDNIIRHSRIDMTYGIRVHDGGASYIKINHCPWCGARLLGNKPK